MQRTQIENFAGFVSHVEKTAASEPLVLFRGQDVERGLLPRVARGSPDVDTTEREKLSLAQLRRLGAAYLHDRHDNDWELLITAQHFGLATRLLDWTSSPLIALWFACSSARSTDAYIYVLRASKHLIPEDHNKGPFDQSKTRVLQPKMNNPRIVAQHGWFTAHRSSKSSGKFVPLEQNSDIKQDIGEIVIPAKARASVLKSLDRNGVSYRTIFPDLEGLCRYISWRDLA